MNYFQRRRLKKVIHHLLHDARHAYHMRADIADPAVLNRLKEAREELVRVWRKREFERIEPAAERLLHCVSKVYPQPKPKHAHIREFVEVLIVAFVVAWALRTYFVQPFKIPTGSMQPTLYGIHYAPQATAKISDLFPVWIFKYILFGERYQDRESQVKKNGDHIFVDRIKYNFVKPKRGDIFVFNTKNIKHPQIKPDQFYIKRLAGLPGEKIAIDPPYLLVDGERIMEPYPFRRMAIERPEGYVGYRLGYGNPMARAILTSSHKSIQLREDEYFPLGDNTRSSLDGRYFGGVPRKNIIGPAFAIYWPFRNRWGLVK